MRLGLSAWVIQDGELPNFAVGDSARFAVSFYAPEPPYELSAALSFSARGTRSCTHLRGARFKICGRIIFHVPELTVIDFGHHAYCANFKPSDLGRWVSGELVLGVGSHFDLSSWEKYAYLPVMKSNWRVDRIFRNTTPWIKNEAGTSYRDPTQFSEVEVTKTDAWNDDRGHGSYFLDCTQLPPTAEPA